MTTKKKVPEKKVPEKKVPERRMHSIILKEKDKEGNWLSIDVDAVLPFHIFGEGQPMIIAIVDDHAYFIPLEQLNWFEQNWGVEKDAKMAHNMVQEKISKMNKPVDDAAFN